MDKFFKFLLVLVLLPVVISLLVFVADVSFELLAKYFYP